MSGVGELNLMNIIVSSSFNWKIKDFLVEINNGQNKPTPLHQIFSCITSTDNKETECVIILTKKTDKVRFGFTSFDNNRFTISYSISILDKSNKKCFTKEVASHEFGSDCPKKRLEKLDYPDYNQLKANASTLLPEGTLTILFDMKIILNVVKRPQSKSLSLDLDEAFTNMNNSDCVILCGDEKINCHTFMLEARSPVFKAMLGNGFQEGITKTIKIETFTPAAIKESFYDN